MPSLTPKSALTFIVIFFAAAGLHAAPVTLRLKNGEVIIGEITKREGTKIYIDAELLGSLVIDEASVAPPAAVAATVETPIPVEHHVPSAAAPIPVVSSQSKVTWAGQLTVMGSYKSAPYKQGPVSGSIPGLTGAQIGAPGTQKSAQISGAVSRTSAADAFWLEGSYDYASYQPSPVAVVDDYSATLAWNHVITPADFTVSRTIYGVDYPRGIARSFVQMAGFGHKFIDTPQDKLDIIPGLVLSNTKENFVFDNQWKLGYGFLENYSHVFNPYMSLEQRILARNYFDRASFYVYTVYVGFTGMLTKALSLKVGATYDYDNAAPGRGYVVAAIPATFYPSNKGILTLTTGLQYKFGGPAK